MKTIWTISLVLFLISNYTKAQDTLYVYKAGAVIFKQPVTDIDSINFYNSNAINYKNGNDAYWNESVLGHRPVKIHNGNLIFTYDPTNKQYISGNYILIPNLNQTPNGELVDRNSFYGFNGGSKSNTSYQWDGQRNTSLTDINSIFDMRNLFVSPISSSQMTYAQAINANTGGLCTNSSNSSIVIDLPNSSLAYPNLSPKSGSFNLWNGEELVTGGNLKNSSYTFDNSKNEFFSQQQLDSTTNISYCVKTYGRGWRLPTDIEIGNQNNTYQPSATSNIDQGYQGATSQIFTSTQFHYPDFSFYKWYVTNTGNWNNIDQWNKTEYYCRCVYQGR